jgi:hypothetical protein
MTEFALFWPVSNLTFKDYRDSCWSTLQRVEFSFAEQHALLCNGNMLRHQGLGAHSAVVEKVQLYASSALIFVLRFVYCSCSRIHIMWNFTCCYTSHL